MPNRPTFKEADSIDLHILKLLQENARLSMTELASTTISIIRNFFM